jgi:hypothetical protein
MIKKPLKVDKFLGVNNVKQPQRIAESELQSATNMDITEDSKIRRRKGYEKVYTGMVSSVHSDDKTILFREGSMLMKLDDSDNSAEVLRYNISTLAPMEYLSLNGDIYYTDHSVTGVVQNGVSRTWGLEVPPPPSLADTVGELPSGRYQVALSFVRNDGQEGGTQVSAHVDVTNGGIAISDIATSDDPTVTHVQVFMSHTDGEALYRGMILANGEKAVNYRGTGNELTSSLMTELLTSPPPGHLLAYYNGRIYIADGNVLWYTEPYKYELINLAHNFIPFPERITMVAPVKDGIWLSTTSETHWLGGEDPTAFKSDEKDNHGAIEGTAREIEGQLVRTEGVSPGQAWLWATQKGICVGTAGGFFRNLTHGRYEFPAATRGIGMVREGKDLNQYMVGLYYSRFISLPPPTISGAGTTS